MKVEYSRDKQISVSEFIDLLERSGLAERRPVAQLECIEGMLRHAGLSISAWLDGELIGIARSVTDFHYACYLSDLAVDARFQNQGIGKELQKITQNALGPLCKLILLAAPAADAYYQKLGFSRHPRCWVIERNEQIK